MSLDYKFTAKELISEGRIAEDDINTIKEFLEELKESCVPKCLPEEFIATMLLACSNDIALTKTTILTYFNLKKLSPNVFDNRNFDDEGLQLALKTVSFASIHWPEENTEIIYVKHRDTNYRNSYMEPQVKACGMIIDSTYVSYPPDGFIMVVDMKGLGLMHLTRIKFDCMEKLVHYFQDGLPVKLKSFHFVNSNFILNKVMAIFRLFMKPELFIKLHFHRGTEEFANFIPKHYIPMEFGGDNLSIEDHHINLVNKLKGMKKYFSEEEAFRKQCL